MYGYVLVLLRFLCVNFVCFHMEEADEEEEGANGGNPMMHV